MAGSSFQQVGSSLPLGRFSIPDDSSHEELASRQKRNKSSFGMYQSERDSMTLTPLGARPYTKLMKNESQVGPRYTSPTKLSSVKELLKERRDLQRDDSANYVYAPKRAGKSGLAQILERKKRKERVLAPSLDQVNDSLFHSDLLQNKSTQPVFIHESTSRTGGNERTTETSQIEKKEELKEPKFLRELREARQEENNQERERKMATLPLKFHMTKALYKLKKAGAVEQERAKYSGNNFQRMKMEMKNNRELFGERKAPEPDEEQEKRLEELHRSEKLKQTKLEKRAKDDGSGTFVPYITAKMIAAAERETNNLQNRVRLQQREGWMKRRQMKGSVQYQENRERVQFAKSIFTTWDTNKNGRLDVKEIADPMMTLGLSHNYQFVEQVLNSIRISNERIPLVSQNPSKRLKSSKQRTEEHTAASPDYSTRLPNTQHPSKSVSREKSPTTENIPALDSVRPGLERDRGKQKVDLNKDMFGLHGIGSKEGDVLSVKDFVNLFKTDKVSDLIARVVVQDYQRKKKKEWEIKQMSVTRAGSPFSSLMKRESSPLKLELQRTLHKLTETNIGQESMHQSNVYSPLPGADHFFAASGRSLQTAPEEKLAINIQQENEEEQKLERETSTSLGFGMPEAPDTSVFSFLGPDQRSQRDKNLLSSLLSDGNSERRFMTAGNAGFMRKKTKEETPTEPPQTQYVERKSADRRKSSVKKKRENQYIRTLSKLPPPDYQGKESPKVMRVKALRSKPDLDSIPSAQVLPDEHHLFSAQAFATPVSNQKDSGALVLTKMLSRLDSGSVGGHKAPNFQKMHPSLAEQLEVVRDWWEEISAGVKQRKSQEGLQDKQDEVLPLRSVIDYLLKRKIVANKDTVDRLIKKMLACDTLSLSYIRYEDFANLFTRSLFRECILYTAREIQKHQASILRRSTRDDSLNRRLSGITQETQETSTTKEKSRRSPRNQTGFGSSLGRFGEGMKEEGPRDTDCKKKHEPQFSMSFKMSSYERSLMIDGLTRGSKYFKIGREALDALVNFHNPSTQDYSVYNIIRLLGELRGDQDIFLKEEAKRQIILVEEEQLPNRAQILSSLPEDIEGEDNEEADSDQPKQQVKISGRGLNLLSWRRDANTDTYRSRIAPDEIDKQIDKLFMNEKEKEAYLPNRYKNLTPRERKNRDKRLLQGLQEYVAKEDPLVKARRLEKKAAEVFEKND